MSDFEQSFVERTMQHIDEYGVDATLVAVAKAIRDAGVHLIPEARGMLNDIADDVEKVFRGK